MDLSLVLIFMFVFFASFYLLRKQPNLPPGPFRIPLLGSLFFLYGGRKFRPHEYFSEAAKKYGDVLGFWLGPQLVVVINGYDAIKEALVKQADAFSGRPFNINALREGFAEDGDKPRGVLFNEYGHSWRLMRRFTLQVLRDFGVGKTSIEDKVMTEVDVITELLEKEEGKPINVNIYLQNLVSNVINAIVFGRRHDFDDPEFQALTVMTRQAASGEGLFELGNILPNYIVKILDSQGAKRMDIVVKAFREMRRYVLEQIDDHEASFDKNNIRDFIDLYLKTMEDGSVKDKEGLDKEEMFRVIIDLFLAGSETTSTTLDWAMLYISEYPEVQAKCQEEISEHFGDKTLLYADRGKLVYVEATLLEIQRVATIVPTNVAHRTLKDTELCGFTIPKGTMVLPSIYSACFDERHWDRPQEFRPERFIEGGKLKTNEALIPFSTGPRQCLGEPLARMELFLVFANLLQRFKFEPEDRNVKSSFDSVMHQVTNVPKPYKTRVYRRS